MSINLMTVNQKGLTLLMRNFWLYHTRRSHNGRGAQRRSDLATAMKNSCLFMLILGTAKFLAKLVKGGTVFRLLAQELSVHHRGVDGCVGYFPDAVINIRI